MNAARVIRPSRGFFRQYELYYDVADERDAIRLRTNYRKNPPEEVHLYSLHGQRGMGGRYSSTTCARVNALHEHAAFYNTLTANCTSNIWLHARVNPGRIPYSWKILFSGYFPEYLYESGRLDTSIPFAELQKTQHHQSSGAGGGSGRGFLGQDSRRTAAREAAAMTPLLI